MTSTTLKLLILLIPIFGMAQMSESIDLQGEWRFSIDKEDIGEKAAWYNQELSGNISLPGSMNSNGLGDDVSVETYWIGEILDSSWYTEPKYAKYRQEGNVKIPFWLQPNKHYIGAAWYQKTIKIPEKWANKPLELFLERPHWESKVWIGNELLGMQNRLGTPHKYIIENGLSPGEHIITIRIDNRIKEVNPGVSSHSISDQTQTNWNGIIGKMMLKPLDKIIIENVRIYPDVVNNKIHAAIDLKQQIDGNSSASLSIQAMEKKSGKLLKKQIENVQINKHSQLNLDYEMGNDFLLWDEFNPNLYSLIIEVKTPYSTHRRVETFGMRDFKKDGKHFKVNGRPIYLRGTLECSIFPLTGFPSMEYAYWEKIYKTCQSFGLNHVRFHSWCPPKVAFEAADDLGIYLQVEASAWTNDPDSKLGNGDPIDEWLYEEGEAILKEYGNHPSFCLMTYGNEPGGENKDDYLRKYVNHFKKLDSTKLYAAGAGWPFLDNADYYNHAGARIQGWGQGLKSRINAMPPSTNWDHNNIINKTPMPYVSHEIGQWCVYPNFDEIPKYTGVLKANNFKIFQETLDERGLGNLADTFLLASGKLQTLCYKADIEASLRTAEMAGFQLLDLHDFPGQGTALVGVLDAFWDEKGYVSAEEYRSFCNETVVLARMAKHTYTNNESFEAHIEISHHGEIPLSNQVVHWEIRNHSDEVLFSGQFKNIDLEIKNGNSVGRIKVPLSKIKEPSQLKLKVGTAITSNAWDIWVYPAEESYQESDVLITDKFDEYLIAHLDKGGSAILNINKGDVKVGKGGEVGVGFSSIFWNTAYTSGQKPHTLGILCNPNHKALELFPTQFHSNWQWWDAMSHSNAFNLDEIHEDLKPIVRIIDDWFENRDLALIFEVKIGKGKLLVSGVDLHSNMENRLEAKQLLKSLIKYTNSEEFKPSVQVSADVLNNLFVKP